jgi:hypothetical protein
MLIDAMPEVLSWSAASNVLQQVRDAFAGRAADLFIETIGEIRSRHPCLASSIATSLRALPDEAFCRLLLAPETTERLFWHWRHRPSDVGQFLARSIRAEAARLGSAEPFHEDTWSALGDIRFGANGIIHRMPQLPGLMPLDFGSPYSMNIDMTGDATTDIVMRPSFTSREVRQVLRRLKQAAASVKLTSPFIADFVVHFNLVLVLLKEPSSTAFASGSNGDYVGRSFIVNPHASDVSEVHLAEAIVHEGIHGLLYMQERLKPWILDPNLETGRPKLNSPWTGSSLTLRSYLQACFVWYGLLHFWCLSLPAGAFQIERIKARIGEALRGFLAGPLLGGVTPYSHGISPEIIAAIREMQFVVTHTFATATTCRYSANSSSLGK